jgi:hypothetical protein
VRLAGRTVKIKVLRNCGDLRASRSRGAAKSDPFGCERTCFAKTIEARKRSQPTPPRGARSSSRCAAPCRSSYNFRKDGTGVGRPQLRPYQPALNSPGSCPKLSRPRHTARLPPLWDTNVDSALRPPWLRRCAIAFSKIENGDRSLGALGGPTPCWRTVALIWRPSVDESDNYVSASAL